jgi:acylphosphatase
MKRLTAYVSGNVQHSGYRARVTDIARMLGFKGTVENLDDGRVKIIAEGDEDKLRWFEEAICIKNSLINVSSIEKEYSSQRGDVNRFYKLVEKGETDSRLDTAADHLKSLIVAVNRMNDNLSSKIDQMNDNLSSKIDQMNDNLSSKIDQMNDNLSSKIDQMNNNLSSKMDVMIDLQKDALSGQEILIEEVRQSREEIKGRLDQRFDKLESEVAEMRGALKSKGII